MYRIAKLSLVLGKKTFGSLPPTRKYWQFRKFTDRDSRTDKFVTQLIQCMNKCKQYILFYSKRKYNGVGMKGNDKFRV